MQSLKVQYFYFLKSESRISKFFLFILKILPENPKFYINNWATRVPEANSYSTLCMLVRK